MSLDKESKARIFFRGGGGGGAGAGGGGQGESKGWMQCVLVPETSSCSVHDLFIINITYHENIPKRI